MVYAYVDILVRITMSDKHFWEDTIEYKTNRYDLEV